MTHDDLPPPPAPAAGIRLACADPGRLPPLDGPVARALWPATALLYEWTDYWATCPGATNLAAGGRAAPRLPGGVFLVRFENRLGRAELQAGDDAGPVGRPLVVEVISTKFASAADYVRFTASLLSDLFARSLRLPFAVDAPTARAVAEARQPPTPLFLLHFLSTCGDDLAAALRMILRQPHQDAVRLAAWIDAARAFEADADALLDVATSPERWVRAPRPDLPIARRLGGHVPRDIRQPIAEVTHDTPENRFARAFLEALVRGADDLPRRPWWSRVPHERRGAVARVGRACRRALAHPVFATVGPLSHVPTASRVLMRREGYRELYDLWRRFHRARRPVFAAVAEAIDLRDIALLYEVWAFYSLVDAVAAALGQPPELSARLTDAEGLAWNARARFGERGQLVYNHTVPSYSTPLRPDYLWLGADGTRVAFDAKFRLGSDGPLDADPADDAATVDEAAVDEAAVDQAAVDQVGIDHAAIDHATAGPAAVDRADVDEAAVEQAAGDPAVWLDAAAGEPGLRYPAIGTMHHYRDALDLAAAIVLYPGRRSGFYAHPSAGGGPTTTLADILSGRFQGVGAIGMAPRADPGSEA